MCQWGRRDSYKWVSDSFKIHEGKTDRTKGRNINIILSVTDRTSKGRKEFKFWTSLCFNVDNSPYRRTYTTVGYTLSNAYRTFTKIGYMMLSTDFKGLKILRVYFPVTTELN